ncbi:MAG: methyltransferase domain-containing protein [Pseudomonadota bacterium]|jgi:predicted membrane-bound spermidine synthase|nr:methyltransferase domain-containing protein [Pseudomonadota bacterium]
MAVLFHHCVDDTVYEVRSAGNSRRLYTNGVLHSQFNSRQCVTGSVWDLLWLPLFFNPSPRPERVLLLGVGAGAVVRQLASLVRPQHVIGIEIDPLHLTIAREFFGVTKDMATLVCTDAREYVQRYRGPSFDLVVDDLFTGTDGCPRRALAFDEAWLRSLRRVLKPTGTLTVNFADRAELKASSLPLALSSDKVFAAGFELHTPVTENIVAAMLGQRYDSAALRAHLQATPCLSRHLRSKRLRYGIRPMTA